MRFVIPYMFSGRGLGLRPRRFWFSSLRSHSMSITLLRPLTLPGLPGGIPGGGSRLREGFHVRGAPYSHGRPEAHREHPRRGALAPLVFAKR